MNNIVYVHEETKKVMNIDRRLCFVELNKYQRNKSLYKRDVWSEFLLAESEEEFLEIEKGGGIMSEAVKELGYFTKEYKDRYWDDMYKKAELDHLTDVNCARKEGISIGEIRGMLVLDAPIDKIQELTGASLEEIEEVRKNM